jgi:hypothetical protein
MENLSQNIINIYIEREKETAKCSKPAKYSDTAFNATYIYTQFSRTGIEENVFCQVRTGYAAGCVQLDVCSWMCAAGCVQLDVCSWMFTAGCTL